MGALRFLLRLFCGAGEPDVDVDPDVDATGVLGIGTAMDEPVEPVGDATGVLVLVGPVPGDAM